MNKIALQCLYQELPELVNKGVLTKEAADAIRRHYGEVKVPDKKRFILILCAVLGSSLIGLGIILLLAHNWEQFSRFTRAILSFVPLIAAQGMAFWVLLKRPNSSAFKEGAAIFLSLMVGAAISLISQTYHIQGDTSDFILTWMLLIVPLVYLMDATMPAAIYLGGITSWAGSCWYDPFQAVLYWPLAAVVVPHFIWSLRRKEYNMRATVLAFVMAVSVCFAADFSLGKTWPGSWIIIYSSIFAIIYFAGYWKFNNISVNWQRPLRAIGAIGVVVFAFVLTYEGSWKAIAWGLIDKGDKLFKLQTLPDHLINMIIVSCALVLFYDYVKRKQLIRLLFGGLPVLAIIGYSLSGISVLLPLALMNLYLLGLSIYLIMLGIRTNKLGTVNTGMLVLAALILARFFDSDMDFLVKGLVFIVLGAGFLLTNVRLVRQKGGAR